MMNPPLGKCLALALSLGAGSAHGEGHGPLFGLATPTLGAGQWSSDTGFMRMEQGSDGQWRAREMIGYGINEDLQATVTLPLDRRKSPMVPNARGGAMMGQPGAVEASLLWRFHREAPRIGVRRESSLLIGLSGGDEFGVGGRDAGPSLHLAAVTGYASRTTYWWLGGGGQWHRSDEGTRRGNLVYATAVFGWRPPVFRGDYPKPDWRLFVEAVAEHAAHDRVDGLLQPNSGGNRLLAGPSVLGLFGPWGLSAGVLFPIDERLNGEQPKTDYRAKVVFTYWFLRSSDMKATLYAALITAAISGANNVSAEGLMRAKLVIFGMDCAPCAYGMEKGLKALAGVETVTVSLNEGYAAVSLTPASSTSLADIREVVRKGGFTPKDTEVELEGTLLLAPRPTLSTSAGNFTLEFVAAGLPTALQARRVMVRGRVAADSTTVRVERIGAASER